MGRGLRSALCRSVLALLSVVVVAIPPAFSAQAKPPKTVSAQPGSAQPIDITAEHIEYLQGTDVYEAEGSVVIVQGPLRLTADRVTIMMLSGTLIATGHVHLSDPKSDMRSERLELDVNTEAGVVTNGELNIKFTDTLVTGRLFQRFSEDHYRVKDGSFTNCDVKEGVPPAWRFTFKDLDLNMGESVYAKDLWLCVNDIPVLPLPTLTYPVQTNRRSGFLVPTAGYNTVFGTTYTQGYFWAINPSRDMTVTPNIMTNRGYGSDIDYRYILNRKTRGQWLLTFLQDTTEDRKRALLTGTHVQQVNPDLSIRVQAFLVTDRSYLNNLSNSGTQRALPSGDSTLYINQRFANGNLYLLGQFLQPITAGGTNTFQRLPEIGHRLVDVAPFDGPLLVSMDTTLANFYREQGFGLNRVDLMPTLSTDVLEVGHVVGFLPKVRLREIYYTKSVDSNGVGSHKPVSRETFWASLAGTSRVDRRFGLSGGGTLLHTIEPYVVYEYVPPTKQSDIIQIDDVDDLPKKNLITYSLRSRLLEQGPEGSSKNWVDLTVAQSYHPGSTPNETRPFALLGDPLYANATAPLQPPSIPVDVRKFSDIWTRVVLGNPVIPGLRTDQFGRPLRTAQFTVPQERQLVLTLDTFYDPYRGMFSQFNTDLRYQDRSLWYVEVGQRFTNGGNRVRRGDIWNPISFNTVFAPTAEVDFVTASAAFRTPLGWTVGAKSYYDIKAQKASETDVVALYQNPCRCWSLGLFYMIFPDRTQYNFMISLTGVGWTENFGTAVVKSLLSPLLIGERGLPWAAPGGPYGMQPATPSAPPGPTKP